MTFPPILWEAINVLLSSLCALVVIIFGRYIIFEVYRNGIRRTRLRAAIGISVAMSGEVVTRGSAAIGRHLENIGSTTRWMLDPPWGFVPLVGAIITTIGLLCLIRVFSPDEWGAWGWIACAAVAFAVTGITVFS